MYLLLAPCIGAEVVAEATHRYRYQVQKHVVKELPLLIRDQLLHMDTVVPADPSKMPQQVAPVQRQLQILVTVEAELALVLLAMAIHHSEAMVEQVVRE
jgi:hypothetical protein